MGADGWAGYPEDKAVGKTKPGENMIASKMEGTGPTEPTNAVEIPIQVQRLRSDPCLFYWVLIMSEDLCCKRCGEADNLETSPCFDGSPHYAKMSCGSCGAFIKFLPKPKNTGKRPPNRHTPESLGIAYCQLCRRPVDMLGAYEALEVHHVVEIQHGGADLPENIWVLCTDCHKTLHHRRTYLYEHHIGTMNVDKLRGLMDADRIFGPTRAKMEELFWNVKNGRR